MLPEYRLHFERPRTPEYQESFGHNTEYKPVKFEAGTVVVCDNYSVPKATVWATDYIDALKVLKENYLTGAHKERIYFG